MNQEMREGENVVLWTRQLPQVWEELQEKGVYRVKEEYIVLKNDTIADYYLELYRWYTREAGKYLELEPEEQYPVWLSLDEGNMLQPTENTVILKLEIPRNQFLFCNTDAWGYRVNYWYIPTDDEDAKKHEAELKRYGIHSDDEIILTDKGNFYPALKRKITDSWERVFTLKTDKKEMMVATAWEIRREWVKEVRRYDGE
ncbi:DUF3841 domain-containing protein [Hespellia stercorisuis]|uniref:DUF3841 domain-containing protein n=1 Tax=Hespellia stercorisuis DSM 15480 TaxID=1121950 RepID=A0A1M6RUL3_9FIRM|nr:DUF3841 domain-containing protein [Hespellia stercorisuis]SHK36191.1 protein of unknown function [Hespellia stercorisuis DSM 15480]